MNLPALPDAAHGLAAAVRLCAADPADQVRMLLAMVDAAEASDIFATLLRRAALVQLARATADYQPTSYQDARAVRLLVCGALDAEILRAGDGGEDDAYAALRDLRIAVTLDLTTRGDPLPRLRAVTVPNLPAAVLAHSLYGDAMREAELVRHADPVHPAFMPAELVVLDR